MGSVSDLERAHSVVGAGLNSLVSIAFATGGAVAMGMILMAMAIKENYGTLYSETTGDSDSGSQ